MRRSQREDPLKRKAEGCFGFVFFGLFAIAGMGALFATLILPGWRIFEARGWQLETCVITSSEVEEFHDSDGSDTYKVAIKYTYELGGQTYHGDRYDFSFGSSSGYDGKKRVVDNYPVGSEEVCFVDPDDPSRAVLNRDPGSYLLWSLLALPFLLVGVGGLLFMMLRPKQRRKAKNLGSSKGKTGFRSSPPSPPAPSPSGSTASGMATASLFDSSKPAYAGEIVDSKITALADAEAFPVGSHGHLVLEPSGSAKAMLIVSAVFAVVFNVIVVLWILPDLGISGESFDWFELVFVIPFALVGLGSIGGFIYFALASTNPKPRLVLDRARPVLGDTCRLSWTFAGDVTKIDTLTVTLQARETAVYQQGTNTRTAHHVFFEQVLTETRHVESRGSATFQIPADTMPTFEAQRNRVEWQLVIHGDIPRWPDVKETLTFPVFPPGLLPADGLDTENLDGGDRV